MTAHTKNMDVAKMKDASTGSSGVHVFASCTAATSSARGGGIPASIPRDQAYYWTTRWQSDEAEALEDLRRGDSLTFDSPGEAIKWLLSNDD